MLILAFHIQMNYHFHKDTPRTTILRKKFSALKFSLKHSQEMCSARKEGQHLSLSRVLLPTTIDQHPLPPLHPPPPHQWQHMYCNQAGSPRSRCQHDQVLMRILFWDAATIVLCCTHIQWKNYKLSGAPSSGHQQCSKFSKHHHSCDKNVNIWIQENIFNPLHLITEGEIGEISFHKGANQFY